MRAASLTLFNPAFVAQVATPVSMVTPALFNPVRWYDAAYFSGILANDAVISPAFPWDDQSSNDDDAVSTNGYEPTFHTNSINGRPIVRFAGANHMIFESVPQSGDLLLNAFTILCVALSASDSNYVSRDQANRQIRTNYLQQPRASWFVGNSGSELVSNQFLSNASQPRMIGHRRTVTPSLLFHFFDNLTEVLPTTGGVDSSVFGINQIGTKGEFSTPLNIDIAELVIYNTALTNEEIRALYNEYFKPKFALP